MYWWGLCALGSDCISELVCLQKDFVDDCGFRLDVECGLKGEYLLTVQYFCAFVFAISLFFVVLTWWFGFFCVRIEAVFHRVRNVKVHFKFHCIIGCSWPLVVAWCWRVAGSGGPGGSGGHFLFFNL